VHHGWRGLAPLALNPRFGQAPNQANFVPLSAIAATECRTSATS